MIRKPQKSTKHKENNFTTLKPYTKTRKMPSGF
jgi:hypothetical protein